MGVIKFYYHNTPFKLQNSRNISKWLKLIFEKEKADFSSVNYIFCNDEHLLTINQKYLGHDEYTDIITFSLHEPNEAIESEIYISVNRVKDNSKTFNRPFQEELSRVMAHGILHLLGYRDKKASEKAQMRKKEEAYLSLLK